jgi:hypothetical protein
LKEGQDPRAVSSSLPRCSSRSVGEHILVHGAVIDAKVNDSYFSIVSRRDDEAVPTDPQAVHALLSAGRAALRAPVKRRRAPKKGASADPELV